MARKSGNQKRCRACGCLAGTDGWCRKHRPVRKNQPYVRDNYVDNNFMTKNKEFWGDSYAAVSDEFPCVKKGE